MTEAIPWQQPLFMVYDCTVDKQVPLTQKRLDDLLRTEQAYAELTGYVRKIQFSRLAAIGAPQEYLDRWAP